MDVFVFDKSFTPLGVIDGYESLIWRREFNNVGSFELHTTIDETLELLQKGNLLVKEDDPYEAMEIETIEMTDGEVDKLVVKGNSIANFLNERIVWGLQTYTGTVEDVIKGFVQNNCITPSDTNRTIPHLALSTTPGTMVSVTEQNSYGNLVDLIKELSIKYDVGWRILFDEQNAKYWFDVYKGTDSSVNQDINPHVIFSSEYENVLEQKYIDSDTSFKNTALVGGQGDGPDRKLVLLNSSNSGFQRRELFVDADDISKEDENGNPISDSAYTQLLTERGNSKLAELQPIKTFESGISVLSNLIYKQDYNLGDIVTLQNVNWGLTINTRITSVEEVYEKDKQDIRVNFGSNIPTIIDKIKRAVRK